MDINAFKNPYTASLLDYLGNNKTGYFDSVAQNILSTYAQKNAAATEAAVKGDTITLSEEAQKLLAEGAVSETSLNGVQQGAADFMMSFFDQSSINLANLSDETLDLLDGLQGVIGGVSATGRDMLTDAAETRYSAGAKKAYTLTGEGQRLRVAMELADGKPSKLTITDITGGQVETAEITLSTEDGVAYMNIERTQRAYQNGHMVDLEAIEPLSVRLYAA